MIKQSAAYTRSKSDVISNDELRKLADGGWYITNAWSLFAMPEGGFHITVERVASDPISEVINVRSDN